MAEGGTMMTKDGLHMSQSETGFQRNEPITDHNSTRSTRDGRMLISFDSFEKSDMLPDYRGWLTECSTKKQYWCVAASNMLGLFDSPEGDELKRVLTLSDFHLEASIKESGENCDAETCESSRSRTSNSQLLNKEFILELTPVSEGDRIFSFSVPTEEEFSLWSSLLHSFTEKSPLPCKLGMTRQKNISFEESRRTDSGLGEEFDTSPSARRKIPKQMSVESDTASRDGEWQSRGSSFVSSLATNDDLADSHSISDSASCGNSTVNLSEIEFADSETNSQKRNLLSDSVFLGGSQELDAWDESHSVDGDSAPTSPRHPTVSSVSSTGDATEGSRSDHSKTVISKVTKLVQRALIRRPRVTSGLTLGHLPDPKMSGPMRKKGKSRWYVLNDTYLYCFKTNSPEAEAESILDLNSYSVALATERKEDGQSIGLLKLTHSAGKKVLFSINSTDTAQLWYDYINEAIRLASSTKASRSDSQKSTGSNSDSQGHTALSSRLSRESFEESYGYFERQSSLRAQRDAVDNAITEVPKADKQESSSGSSAAADGKQESRSLSDFESVASSSVAAWGSSDDLDLTDKKANTALSLVKRSIRPSLLSKRRARQMPISACDVVDPTLTGNLRVFMPNKGTWKKSWAVLKDDWLYFYKKPTDSSTSDIIELSNYTIQRERTVDDGTPLTSQKYMFSILNKDGSNRAVIMAETEKETRAWMEKLKGRAKKQSATLDGLNLESGSSTRPLLPPESSDKWHTNQAEVLKEKLLKVLQKNLDTLETSSEREDPDLDPKLAKKKAEILSNYEKANDEEAEELVRYLTIQNRRRMSAQVKKDALQRTIGSKGKKRVERIGSVEESAMEDQIKTLNVRLDSINADIEAKSTQKTNRLQALKEKKDLQIQLLEQQERLSRYRRQAHIALQGADFQSALAGLDEESLKDGEGSTEEDVDKNSRYSPKAVEDETDSSSTRPEIQSETVQVLARQMVEKSPPRSPNTRPGRLLPSLPYRKGEKPSRGNARKKQSKETSEEKSQSGSVQTAVDSCQRTDAPLEKKSSPLARLRKISLGSKMAPDPTQLVKETKSRKLSTGMKSSVSFDDGLSLGQLNSSLKHSSSTTDLSVANTRGSPSPRRAASREGKDTSTASPQRRRRKISVPVKMPSMDSLFPSSTSKKDKQRKMSNSPNFSDRAEPETRVNTDRAQIPSPSSSPDINGNVARAGKGQEENSSAKDRAVRDEIDPEVLRDIEEFEMMARKALLEAGWVFRS
ncbi:uncharacterized protein LOC119745386 [Patiria miniata]|uniref:PH domain-containing protein n=1 Tax=Patiria miniata TaxID=46514 RepID=A0A914BNC8_PATMI|nr:uncharacterized protein LOC119745386 [Patiria miniata]